MDSDRIRRRIPTRVTFLIGGLLGLVPLLGGIIAGNSTGFAAWLRIWSQPLTGYLSVLVTLALGYLYHQQKKILQKQNEPVVVTEELTSSQNNDHPTFLVKLKNIGGGPATGVSMSVDPEIVARDTVDSSFPLDEEDTEEYFQNGCVFETPLPLSKTSRPSGDISNSSSSLEAGEVEEFHQRATLMQRHPIMDPDAGVESATNYVWESAVDTLESLGVEDLRLQFWIHYGEGDQQQSSLVSDFVIPIDSEEPLSTLIESGEPYHHYQISSHTLQSELN